MKILHLTKYLPTFPGGIEKVTSTMAYAAASKGHEVQVLGFSPRKPAKLVLPPKGVALKGVTSAIQVGKVPLSLEYLKEATEAFDGQDVVHIHLPNPMGELAALRLLARPAHLRPKVVPLLHAPIVKWGFLGRLWEKLVQGPLLKKADQVLLASENLRQFLKKRGVVIPEDRCAILPYGMAPAPEIPAPIVMKPFHIVAVARLVSYKGLDYLVSAMSRVQGDWHLTVVGTGPKEKSLRRQIARLNLEKRITLETQADEPRKHSILAGCDLFVQPSQTAAEAFGLSMVEAFCHRKPVITTDLSTGVAFLARQGKCGAVVPVRNVAQLAASIQDFLTTPEKFAHVGQENYDFWKSHLTLDLYQEHYLTLLHALHPEPSETEAHKQTDESTRQTPPPKMEPHR